MITVITGAAVAFFQSTRIERFVSRNYSDLARAQLAAEAGQAAAGAILQLVTANDHFIIVANANRQLFAGNGSNQIAGNFAYQPLWSCGSNATSLVTTTSIVTTGAPTFSSATTTNTNLVLALPGGLTVTSPSVAWVNLTNTSGRTNARFAFWMEDLSGRLDLSVAGTNGSNALRPTGTNPAEQALWVLFNPSVASDTNNPVVANLTNARLALVTPATAPLLNSSFSNQLPHLTAGLIHDTNEPDLVPYGFNYADQGQPKLNLNQAITSANALNLITSEITNNLPSFTNRAGAMDGQAYVYALAANIIDYADANSSATTTTVNGMNIVGFDNYPMLTHVFDSFLYNSNAKTITHTTWMQFWNPSTLPTLTGNVTVNFTNNDTVRYASSANPSSFITNRLYPAPGGTTTNFSLPALNGNAGFVTNFVRPVVSLAGFPNFPVAGPFTIWLNCQTGSVASLPCSNSFGYSFAGINYAPVMTLKRQIDTLTSVVNFSAGFLSGNQYIPANANAGIPLPIHDPRMLPYLGQGTSHQYAQSQYSDVYWRGYVSQNGLSQNMGMADPSFWPDGSSANVASHGTVGGATPPAFGLFQNAEPAPCRLKNTGSYANLSELGNVFDPMQWKGPNAETTANLANSDINATWSGDSVYGGGATLRIGRPEHSRFTNNGLRAAQLLDLFAVGTRTTNGGATVLNSVAGRINLNTATTNTLRALVAGVRHTNDPRLASGGTVQGTNYDISTNAVSFFVRAVTNARALRPFASPSQLTLLTNNVAGASWPANAAFGNGGSPQVMGPNTNIWTDAAAEEWFSKIYPLCTVRSRNFLIYVVAQAMSTNTNQPLRPIAGQSRMIQVYAEPVRNSTTGLTTNVNVRVLRSWSL